MIRADEFVRRWVVAQTEGIESDLRTQRCAVSRIWRKQAQKWEHIERGRASDDVTLRSSRHFLARTEQQILTALSRVRPGQTHVRHGSLPEVVHHARCLAYRHFYHVGTVLPKIEPREGVRCGGVRSENA